MSLSDDKLKVRIREIKKQNNIMKLYIVLNEYNGRFTVHNVSTFNSKAEAVKHMRWYMKRAKVEEAARREFWGHDTKALPLQLGIAEINIPVNI